ncbi:MAG TPA: ATP-grasp domain-containing protein [Patescibacteria group bacterium]
MPQPTILVVGFSGEKKFIQSALDQGFTLFLLISKANYKEEYSNYFEKIFTVDNIFDWREISKAVSDLHIDGAITRFEKYVMVVSVVNTILHLPSVDFKTAHKFRNKYLMKQAFIKHNVPSAKGILIENAQDAKTFIEENNFPLFLKQISGFSSSLVTKINSYNQLKESLSYFKKILSEEPGDLQKNITNVPEEFFVAAPDPKTNFLLEAALTGKEITVDTFVTNNTFTHTPVCDYILSHELKIDDHHLPIGSMPYSDLSDAQTKLVLDVVEKALRALGANNCVTHAELFINLNTNEINMVEIAARGGGMRGIMTNYVTDDDYYLSSFKAVSGIPDKSQFIPKRAASYMNIFADKQGILKNIDLDFIKEDKNIELVSHKLKIGDYVSPANKGGSFIAKILVKGEEYQDVLNKAKKTLHRIRSSFVIE